MKRNKNNNNKKNKKKNEILEHTHAEVARLEAKIDFSNNKGALGM